jgi:hypothetical protein
MRTVGRFLPTVREHIGNIHFYVLASPLRRHSRMALRASGYVRTAVLDTGVPVPGHPIALSADAR